MDATGGQKRVPDIVALRFRQILGVQEGREIAPDLTVASAGPHERMEWIVRRRMDGPLGGGLGLSGWESLFRHFAPSQLV